MLVNNAIENVDTILLIHSCIQSYRLFNGFFIMVLLMGLLLTHLLGFLKHLKTLIALRMVTILYYLFHWHMYTYIDC